MENTKENVIQLIEVMRGCEEYQKKVAIREENFFGAGKSDAMISVMNEILDALKSQEAFDKLCEIYG